jgi:hypothetical protein
MDKMSHTHHGGEHIYGYNIAYNCVAETHRCTMCRDMVKFRCDLTSPLARLKHTVCDLTSPLARLNHSLCDLTSPLARLVHNV